MEDQTHMLIGNDYAAFAKPPSVLTLAQFEALLQDGLSLQGKRIVLGQGLDAAGLPNLIAGLICRGAADVEAPVSRASHDLTHKKQLTHVLVSFPERLGPATYGFDLIVDGKKDRLSDHVTGQHMGAMLLIEAARQASIVVIECHCGRSDGARWGLMLQGMNCRFDNYAFPVPTHLTVNIRESSHGDSQRALVINVEFTQAGRAVCGIEFNVGLYRSDLLARVEGRRSVQAAAEAISYRVRRKYLEEDLV